MSYDSFEDTTNHIVAVRDNMRRVCEDLTVRAFKHDKSKLEEPEKSCFDEFTPKLRTTTYGSAEYEAARTAMGAALDHHYAVNDHHPEHFPNGIKDMGLLQLVEMLCDWKAAVERHEDGDIRKSIEINAERFGYGEEIKRLLNNTIDYWEGRA